MKHLILSLIFFSTGISFTPQDDKSPVLFQAKDYIFPYELKKPLSRSYLPSKLNEISGIDFISNDAIAAVQDEKGNIYIVHPGTGEILQKIDFGDDGDYEGLAIVKDDAWVLKSKGDLYRVKDFLKDEDPDVKKYETDLSKNNDIEGLTADTANNRLLLSTKGHPYIDRSGGKHKKAVYSFDLKDKKLDSKPVYLIDLEEIKYFRKYNTMTRLGIDLMASLDESKGDVSFQPSDLAIHPLTGNIYIIGSVGDLLIVLDPTGEMLAMVDLDDKLFNQPEGICFGPDGEMFISNEAGDWKATLLKFKMMR
jgi:uncharacterized protein YjiK